jgi:hypothetical protein
MDVLQRDHDALVGRDIDAGDTDDADDDVVGDQVRPIPSRLGLEADRRAGRDRRAQHVAGRELRMPNSLTSRFACVPLPGPGGARAGSASSLLPAASTCGSGLHIGAPADAPWICATVSIVTLTTIRSEVPPK